MLEDFTVETKEIPLSPIIPKFRLSYNSARQPSKYYKPHRQKINSTEGKYEWLNWTCPRLDQDEINFANKTCEFDCKENLSPIILEENHIEMLNLNYPSIVRRPVTSYEPFQDYNNSEKTKQLLNFTSSKISPFDLGYSKMDSVCSKMTESIILSSETIDSLTEMSPSLSNDHFERIKFLGQGKFGQVHLVKEKNFKHRHKLTGFLCALKIISKKVVREEKVELQIAKELRIHSQLKSLNIIDFYGFFDDELFFYILLEYAEGGSVFSKLKGKTRLEEEEILPIAKGLCDGLRFIHRMGFVHRDIKPENVVLQFGIPKICDFGWATDCDNISLCKSYCGTPLYISPEIIRKELYGTSVDIWATGLVIYELLVGRVPFSIWSEEDMDQILLKEIKFPEYVDRSYNCESFIRKCLEKQTLDRMEVSEALRHPFLSLEKQTELNYELYETINDLLRSTH